MLRFFLLLQKMNGCFGSEIVNGAWELQSCILFEVVAAGVIIRTDGFVLLDIDNTLLKI